MIDTPIILVNGLGKKIEVSRGALLALSVIPTDATNLFEVYADGKLVFKGPTRMPRFQRKWIDLFTPVVFTSLTAKAEAPVTVLAKVIPLGDEK